METHFFFGHKINIEIFSNLIYKIFFLIKKNNLSFICYNRELYLILFSYMVLMSSGR